MLDHIITLLLLYQLKHYIADYPLQGVYMLGKFKPGWDFMGPLAAHCLVHAFFTMSISTIYLYYNSPTSTPLLALGLGAFDFVAHFFMDRIKAGPKYLGRFKALSAADYMALQPALLEIENKGLVSMRIFGIPFAKNLPPNLDDALKKFRGNIFFWWALGLDQAWHHLTHYAIIYILLTR